MRACKICDLVKFDFQMYRQELCYGFDCVSQVTFICRKCAKILGDKAVLEELVKIEKAKKVK